MAQMALVENVARATKTENLGKKAEDAKVAKQNGGSGKNCVAKVALVEKLAEFSPTKSIPSPTPAVRTQTCLESEHMVAKTTCQNTDLAWQK